jgi:hypothetical protein
MAMAVCHYNTKGEGGDGNGLKWSSFDAIWGRFDVIRASIKREISGVECDNSFGILVEGHRGGAGRLPKLPKMVIAGIGKRNDGRYP